MSEMSSLSSKQNSPLLTRKVNFKNLLMNENKRIYNPPIKIIECVGAQAQDESKRNVETPQKTCNGRNFQCQKFSVIYSVLAVRRNPFGKRKKSACSKSSSSRFSFSAARNAITKATEYVPLGFSFRVLVFFPLQGSLNVTISDTEFSVFQEP